TVFLCTQKEIDRVILEAAQLEFVPQPIVPLVKSIGGMLRFMKGWRETHDLVRQQIREKKPAVVIGLGGYAAGVAVRRASTKQRWRCSKTSSCKAGRSCTWPGGSTR